MVSLYSPIEMPEFCFLSEAVEFLALGRVPETSWSKGTHEHENGVEKYIEYRFDWREMPDNFEPNHWGCEIFEKAEFDLLGVPYPDGYMEAAERILFGDISDARTTVEVSERFHIESFPQEYSEKGIAVILQAKAVLELSKEAVSLYAATNENFEVHLERAWALLYSEIQKGALEVTALDEAKWEAAVKDGNHEAAAEFIRVPSESMRLGYNFRQNQILFKGVQYVSARVTTNSIVDLITSLEKSLMPVNGEMFGQSILVRGAVTVPKRRRGAPDAIDWEQVKLKLEDMKLQGRIPQKKEACIHELLEFTEKSLGRRVARSTIQARLDLELNEIYAN